MTPLIRNDQETRPHGPNPAIININCLYRHLDEQTSFLSTLLIDTACGPRGALFASWCQQRSWATPSSLRLVVTVF